MKIKIAGFKTVHTENHPADEVREFEGEPVALGSIIFDWASQFVWVHIIDEEETE